MKIGDTIKRKDGPTGKWSTPRVIDTQEQLEHHKKCKEAGVEYIIIHPPKEFGCESCSA